MKKYRVSLSVNVPHNFEIEIEAENEKEAYEKGRAALESNDYEGGVNNGEFVEVDGANPTLDLSDPDKDGEIPNGAFIEEINPIEYDPVPSAGSYMCEHKNCDIIQNDDSTGDVLYYGKDGGMYCIKHIKTYC